MRARRDFLDMNGNNRLLSSHVFDTSENDVIWINKVLPQSTYKIMSEARKRKGSANFKHVYLKSGSVRARKEDRSQEFMIITNADLQPIK